MRTLREYSVSKNHTQYKTKLPSYQKNYIFASGGGRNCAATVVTNNQVDTLLIKQLSDKDTVVVEIIIGNVKTILSTMYFDIKWEIEIDLVKIEENIIT